MYYSKPLKSYEAVCQVLDQVVGCEARPVHWRKPLYAAIDELNEAAAPSEQVKVVEQMTIVLLKLDWALQRGDAEKIEAVREQLARLDADWRSMVEVDVDLDIEPAPAPAVPPVVQAPRSIAQLQDLLGEAGQDAMSEPDDFVAPPRWLSVMAPQEEVQANADGEAGPLHFDHDSRFGTAGHDEEEPIGDTASWESHRAEDHADYSQFAGPGQGYDESAEPELLTSNFTTGFDEVAETAHSHARSSAIELMSVEQEEPWVPRNEGLPFGKPSIAGNSVAATAVPENAYDAFSNGQFAPADHHISSVLDLVDELGTPNGADNMAVSEPAPRDGGNDFLSASRGEFGQSRIDFRDPYRDEEIESVADALERITVRNRFC
jgi:hypothetical protein